MIRVYAFPNCNTAVCDDSEQLPQFQHPWLLSIAEELAADGYDPREVQYNMPNGRRARVFVTTRGLNWEIV